MANQDTDLRCYLTNAGIAAENNSIQLGRKLPVKEMVFGSGLLADGSDPRLQTTMIQEEYAVPCGMLFDPESPTLLVFKGDLPADVGGFHINEVAIRLEDGTLYGYARGKGDYKPTIEQGATDSVRYAVEMYTTNASNVECKIDLSKVYVDWEDLEVRIKAHKSEPEPHSQYHKAEEQRLICLDNYGHTAFVDGFDVTQQADPNKYKITPGVVYVGGLRAVLAGEVLQTITTKPNGIYIDVVRDGTALSAWENTLTIKVSTTPLNDYADEFGRNHYVAKLVGINADGSVVDWRVEGGLDEHESNIDAHNQYLKIDHVVGLVLPDSTLLPVREIAFLADGSDYAVADYPKLMKLVWSTTIVVAQELIDDDPEEYAANFGISADGLRFTVPNYPLKPHLAAAGVFGVVGSTVEDKIQNITGMFGTFVKSSGYRQSISELSGVFGGVNVGGQGDEGAGYLDDDLSVIPHNVGEGSDAVNSLVKYDASRVARTDAYTEVNTSFLNFYIIHGETA